MVRGQDLQSTVTDRWRRKLQVALGLSGGAVWFVGVMWKHDFMAGVGCGLIVADLILRLGRTASIDD